MTAPIGGPLDPGTLLARAVALGRRTVEAYGEAQTWMVVEECGELLTAIARHKRGRATTEDVVAECADVLIVVAGVCAAAWGAPWMAMRAKMDRQDARMLRHAPLSEEER